MSSKTAKHFLLTGYPGVGKTTLVTRICESLQRKNVAVKGFYTEEIRDETNGRIGFDVVTLDGQRGRLARKLTVLNENEATNCRLGPYCVFPIEFETLVLPLFLNPSGVFIIDEIGRMEMYSRKFQQEVGRLFKDSKLRILATIPFKQSGISLIENLRSNSDCTVIIVDQDNRNELIYKITPSLI